jgi:mono/diheme cytochrome c family protein
LPASADLAILAQTTTYPLFIGNALMLRKLLLLALVLVAIGAGGFWVLTAPRTLAAGDLPAHEPDLANGQEMFWAGGCESCHAAEGATGDDQLKLGGGQALKTAFGTFHAPNISPDPQYGIGRWSTLDFVNAMKFGVAPGGRHLYPAFPYTSYQRMRIADLIDLKAFLDTLPAVAKPSLPHELAFPFNIRRGIGLWQLLYVDGKTFQPDPAKSAELNRGAYLVEGPGHCGECHTPRNWIGGPVLARAYGGGPAPEGKGKIPNITSDATGLADWSADDIDTLLTTGFKPNFDSVGSTMAAVVRNTAKLSDADRKAIAAYVAELPPVDSTAQ